MPVQSTFLRRIIGLDAAACAASGALMAFAAQPLAGLTGLQPALTQPTGVFLLAWAAFLAVLATRPAMPRALVWLVIAVNAVWVVESALFLVLGWVEPTALGYGFVIAQAVAVAVIAELQFMALRRAEAIA
jgi:hypothetical protein